jgi:nucleotide-binding universal stress UspA family protein
MSAFAPVLETEKKRLIFKHIAVATDFSEASRRALDQALQIAQLQKAELLIVHAVAAEPRRPVPLDPLPHELDRPLLKAEEQMKRVAKRMRASGVSYSTRIVHGPVWEVLSAAMLRHDTDLLVLGTHGRGALQKLALGSVAEEVLRLADCPVLTVGPRVEAGISEIAGPRTIVFATDFGAASARALPYALSLAERFDAQLVLVHMVPPMPLAAAAYAPAVFEPDDIMQWREGVRDESKARLNALVPPGMLTRKPICIVGTDFLPEGILCAAAEHDADLIVMGANRGTSPRIASHIPWALTHHVICDASCPVLTVRG